MDCPTCIVLLKMGDRLGVEADYRPDRRVGIDCGGLDKIIDSPTAPAPAAGRSEVSCEHHDDDR